MILRINYRLKHTEKSQQRYLAIFLSDKEFLVVKATFSLLYRLHISDFTKLPTRLAFSYSRINDRPSSLISTIRIIKRFSQICRRFTQKNLSCTKPE